MEDIILNPEAAAQIEAETPAEQQVEQVEAKDESIPTEAQEQERTVEEHERNFEKLTHAESKNDLLREDEQVELSKPKYVAGQYGFKNLGLSPGADVKEDANGELSEFDIKRCDKNSFQDIQVILLVLNSLNNGYEKLFSVVKYDKDNYPTDAKYHLKDILLKYHDLEKFLLMVEDNRLKFTKDLRFVQEKFQTMKDLTASMFEYYEQNTQFDEVVSLIPVNDPDYKELSLDIEETRKQFFIERENYIKNAESLMGLQELIVKETSYLISLIQKDLFIKVNVKTDAILRIYPKLVLIYEKIIDQLDQEKVILHSIMAKKSVVDDYITELKIISEGKGKIALQKADPLNSSQSVWKWGICAALLLI